LELFSIGAVCLKSERFASRRLDLTYDLESLLF